MSAEADTKGVERAQAAWESTRMILPAHLSLLQRVDFIITNLIKANRQQAYNQGAKHFAEELAAIAEEEGKSTVSVELLRNVDIHRVLGRRRARQEAS